MIRTRSGNAGIMATLILMFSIVLFIGTSLWLVTDVGFLTGSPDSKIFNPTTYNENQPKTLNQTLKLLQNNGCEVVNISDEYVDEYEKISYEIFLETAKETKTVYLTLNPEKVTVLLVDKQGKIYEWTPDG